MLKPNLQDQGRHDLPQKDARQSADPQGNSNDTHGQTCSSTVDYRIQGIPQSAVRKEDANSREIVKELIQKFENHPNRVSLMEDLNMTEVFNPFNQKSQELITSLGHSASSTAHGASAYSRRRGTDSQSRTDTTPCQFPGRSSRKTRPMVLAMVRPWGSACILRRMIFCEQSKRKSAQLSSGGGTQMNYTKKFADGHRMHRRRHRDLRWYRLTETFLYGDTSKKNSSLKVLGAHDQCGRWYWTSSTTCWLQRSEEIVQEDVRGALSRDGEGTSPFLLDSNAANKKINNSMAWRSMLVALIPIWAGAITLPLPHLPPLRLLSGKQAHAQGNLLHRGTPGQHEIGNRGNLHPGVNSDSFFFFHRSRMSAFFACRKQNLVAIARGGGRGNQHTFRTQFFSCAAWCAH